MYTYVRYIEMMSTFVYAILCPNHMSQRRALVILWRHHHHLMTLYYWPICSRGKILSNSIQIERNTILMTVFLLIMNQADFRLVRNDNIHCYRIPFGLTVIQKKWVYSVHWEIYITNSYWMGYDCVDSFPFNFEPNVIPFGSKSKGKLSPRSYPIQFESK